jgi:hypothetical protein
MLEIDVTQSDVFSHASRANTAALRVARLFSWSVLPLAIVATVVGLLVPGTYRGNANWALQGQAQDLVTLVVALPLLATSLVLAARGSVRGTVLWLGTLGYLIYSYVLYAFDVQFNALFLVYVAILGLAIYSLILGLGNADVVGIARSFRSTTPTGWIGGFLVGVCVLTTFLWLAEDVPAMIAGRIPARIVDYGLPTNPVHVLDLSVVLPGGILTGLLLLRHRPWGYVLAGYYLVKFATLGLVINAINGFSLAAGQPIDVIPGALFAAITIAGLLLTWRYIASIDPTIG